MEPLGATLHVVVCFEDDELVAIWPLVRRRQALWRVVNQLGPLTPDFSDVLVEESPGADAYVAAIWQSVQTTVGADLIILPSVKATTRLSDLLARSAHVKTQTPDIAPYVSWQASDTWETYYDSLGPSTRKKLKRLRRQLQAKGDLRFEAVRAPERMPGLIGWLLQEKRVWADRTGKRGAWLLSDCYERFLVQQAMEQSSEASFVMFLLTLDGEPIAAMFSMEGARHTEGIIASFSASLARLSPGLVLYEYIMRHAFNRGLAFELGIGKEQVKLFWSRDTSHETASYRLGLTPWGVVSLWLLQILKTIRSKGPWLRKNRVSAPVAGQTDTIQGDGSANRIIWN